MCAFWLTNVLSFLEDPLGKLPHLRARVLFLNCSCRWHV